MRTADPTSADSRVTDDLDVEAAIAELGFEAGALDEALAELERGDSGLEALWQVPTDLEDRITRGVRRRFRNRDTAWLVADLTALAWTTAKTLIEPGHEQR